MERQQFESAIWGNQRVTSPNLVGYTNNKPLNSLDMRSRAWRRKKTESKWNSRCKKFMFDSVIEDGKRVSSYEDSNGDKKTVIIKNFRKPSTWKEMKEKDPWAKYLKDSSTSRSYVSDQMDAKHTNKLLRIESKKLINDGIQEWLDEFDESFECWYNEELNEWQPLYQAV